MSALLPKTQLPPPPHPHTSLPTPPAAPASSKTAQCSRTHTQILLNKVRIPAVYKIPWHADQCGSSPAVRWGARESWGDSRCSRRRGWRRRCCKKSSGFLVGRRGWRVRGEDEDMRFSGLSGREPERRRRKRRGQVPAVKIFEMRERRESWGLKLAYYVRREGPGGWVVTG